MKKSDRYSSGLPHDLSTECNSEEIIFESRNLKRTLSSQKIEIRALKEQIAHLQKVIAATSGNATISHELNNPLTIISAEADEILDTITEKSDSQELILQAVRNIKNSALRMRSIINHVLADFNQQEVEPLLKQNLTTIVRETVNFLLPRLRQEHIEIHLDLDETLPEIWGDESKLKSILQNVLVNAIDAFSGMNTEWKKQIQVTTKISGKFIEILTKDNGMGIPAKMRKQVFSPFFTTKKNGGTGLGLAIATKYVREHNGQILLNPEIKNGTEFILRFPLEKRNELTNTGSDRR